MRNKRLLRNYRGVVVRGGHPPPSRTARTAFVVAPSHANFSTVSTRTRASGFTLIEALVALVIIGAFGMALFTWINSSIVSLHRVEDANARNDAAANIIEYMQAVNPMQTPEGKNNFGSYQIQWKSDPVTDEVDGVTSPQGNSLYRLALYQTKISVAKTDDPNWFELKLKLVGYKKVRSATNIFQ